MFGTDGIRGIPNKGFLTSDKLKRIGFSISKLIKDHDPDIKSIFIAKDTRKSCSFILENLKVGLNTGDIGIIDLDVLPTSAVSQFVLEYPKKFGLMITASHNSHEYNGIKIFNNFGEKISDNDQKKINSYFINTKKSKYKQKKELNIIYKNAAYEYESMILDKFENKFKSNLKIGIDLANGASFKVTKNILSKMGFNCIYVSANPSGSNINFRCGVENTSKIKKLITKNNLDLGIAIDGDADRVVFVDSKAHEIEGDKIIEFFSKKILKKGNTLVTTIMTNNIVEKNMLKNKVNVLKTDVGDRNVYFKMKEINSNFGGENSGHYIFRDYLKTSDANFTILNFIKYLKDKKDIDKFSNQNLYPSVLKSFDIKKKVPIKNIDFITNFKKRFYNENKDYYLNIRYSGTENKIRILIQGKSNDIIEKEIDLFGKLLLKNEI